GQYAYPTDNDIVVDFQLCPSRAIAVRASSAPLRDCRHNRTSASDSSRFALAFVLLGKEIVSSERTSPFIALGGIWPSGGLAAPFWALAGAAARREGDRPMTNPSRRDPRAQLGESRRLLRRPGPVGKPRGRSGAHSDRRQL